MVAVGAIARSFKEAQTLLTPIYFLCMAPSLTAALGDFQLRGAALLIPGVNVTLLARDLVVGQARAGAIAVVFGSTVAYGAAALALAARLYDSERLLGADEPGLRLGAWLRRLAFGAKAPDDRPAPAPPPDDARPTAGGALALYALAWVVLLVLAPIQKRNVAAGLLVLEWGGLLGLTALFARSTGIPFARLLRLRRPSARAMVGAVLVGMSAWLVIGLGVDWIFQPPKEVTDALRKVIAPPDQSRGLAFTLFLTAPASSCSPAPTSTTRRPSRSRCGSASSRPARRSSRPDSHCWRAAAERDVLCSLVYRVFVVRRGSPCYNAHCHVDWGG